MQSEVESQQSTNLQTEFDKLFAMSMTVHTLTKYPGFELKNNSMKMRCDTVSDIETQYSHCQEKSVNSSSKCLKQKAKDDLVPSDFRHRLWRSKNNVSHQAAMSDSTRNSLCSHVKENVRLNEADVHDVCDRVITKQHVRTDDLEASSRRFASTRLSQCNSAIIDNVSELNKLESGKTDKLNSWDTVKLKQDVKTDLVPSTFRHRLKRSVCHSVSVDELPPPDNSIKPTPCYREKHNSESRKRMHNNKDFAIQINSKGSIADDDFKDEEINEKAMKNDLTVVKRDYCQRYRTHDGSNKVIGSNSEQAWPDNNIVKRPNSNIVKRPDNIIMERADNNIVKRPDNNILKRPDNNIVKRSDNIIVERSDKIIVKMLDNILVKRSDCNIVKRPDNIIVERPANFIVDESGEATSGEPLGNKDDDKGEREELSEVKPGQIAEVRPIKVNRNQADLGDTRQSRDRFRGTANKVNMKVIQLDETGLTINVKKRKRLDPISNESDSSTKINKDASVFTSDECGTTDAIIKSLEAGTIVGEQRSKRSVCPTGMINAVSSKEKKSNENYKDSIEKCQANLKNIGSSSRSYRKVTKRSKSKQEHVKGSHDPFTEMEELTHGTDNEKDNQIAHIELKNSIGIKQNGAVEHELNLSSLEDLFPLDKIKKGNERKAKEDVAKKQHLGVLERRYSNNPIWNTVVSKFD